MFAVQDTSRGMINILFIGMLTTLAINFANAYTCWNAFQTKKGGWNEGDDRASCNNGVDNYSCSLSQCGGLSAPKIFTQCSTQSGHTGDLHVYALSYTTFRDKFMSLVEFSLAPRAPQSVYTALFPKTKATCIFARTTAAYNPLPKAANINKTRNNETSKPLT
ncbi:hypothetical protein H4Q26_009711 [Puccinia striiformis f. sp. tritici PST-130]|nr:hypothetical protein H4Q26_009711 [Puccinia striiformis f. sp. tritici PST-130]